MPMFTRPLRQRPTATRRAGLPGCGAVSGGAKRFTPGRALAREFLASAPQVAMVPLAAPVALPKARRPGDATVVTTLIGTALAVVVAHYAAFRLAADLTSEAGPGAPRCWCRPLIALPVARLEHEFPH
jgi:hypothetical protein